MKRKCRIKYEKIGRMIFIGHLDFLKLFQRAVKRAEIPIAYSQGFNPHQQISFALPLALGHYGYEEYADMELDGDMSCAEIMDRLNEALPEGVRLTGIRESAGEKNTAALVRGAEYIIAPYEPINNVLLAGALRTVLDKQEILVEKEAKGKIVQIDIRPRIFELDVCSTEITGVFLAEDIIETSAAVRAVIAAGSSISLKPLILMEYIYAVMGLEYRANDAIYKRRRILI